MNTIKLSLLTWSLSLLLLASCQPKATQEERSGEETPAAPVPITYATGIEAFHNKAVWDTKKAIAFDIDIQFGGQPVLQGRITTLTSTGQVRIDLTDSLQSRMIWTGTEAVVSPASSPAGGARFHVLTWPYFLAAPFKLQDPGARLEETGTAQVDDRAASTARLTFASGTGDSPDDWYVVYKEAATEELLAMAYIVTFGKSLSDAEADPHAIVYKGYEMVEGVRIATDWTFTGWSQEGGIGEEIGAATLSNLAFAEPEPGFFEVPADHRVEALPPSGE